MIRLEQEDRLYEGAWLRIDLNASDQRASFLATDRELDYKGRRYRITSREEVRDGTVSLVLVEAEEVYAKLAEKLRVGDSVLVNATPAELMDYVLDGTDWTFVPTDSQGDVNEYALSGTDQSVLALLYKVAKLTGYELRFLSAEKQVTLVDEGGLNRGIGFRYGKNIRSLRRRVEPPKATRLYMFGAQGLDISGQTSGGVRYVEDLSYYQALGMSEAEARAGFTKSIQITDPTFTDDVALVRYASERIAELAKPTISYELSVADLSSVTGMPEDSFQIGDAVRVRDPELNIDVEARVVRLKRVPLSPSQNEIELAYRPDLSGLDDSGSREKDALDWVLLNDDNGGDRNVGQGWTSLLGEIGVSFSEGGKAVFGLDVEGVSDGSGVLVLTIWDDEAQAEVRRWEYDVTAGEFEISQTFSLADIPAAGYLYQMRATIESGSFTYVVPSDNAHFWILAQGGLGSLPTPPTIQSCFEYIGEEDQFFIVPDGVTRVTVDVQGAAGGKDTAAGSRFAGNGGRVQGRLSVTPGQVLKVRVGEPGSSASNEAGWPGGGDGVQSSNSSAAYGYGGGGYSAVFDGDFSENSPSDHDILLLGAGGGGSVRTGASLGPADEGAAGGYPEGQAGAIGGSVVAPSGGTQSGPGPDGAQVGSWLQGAHGGTQTSAFDFHSGGGGGGWYGGNSEPDVGFIGGGDYGSDGGGGSSYFDSSKVSAIVEESGANSGSGKVCFGWDRPSEVEE